MFISKHTVFLSSNQCTEPFSFLELHVYVLSVFFFPVFFAALLHFLEFYRHLLISGTDGGINHLQNFVSHVDTFVNIRL